MAYQEKSSIDQHSTTKNWGINLELLSKNLVSAEGLEPSTNGLKGHCSTIELRAQNE